MLLSLFLTCVVALGISTTLLLLLGHRVRFSFRLLGLVLAALVTAAAGEVCVNLWHLPAPDVQRGEVVIFAVSLFVVLIRGVWNPIAQVFYGTLIASVLSYLAFAFYITFFGGLSGVGEVASALLLVLEVCALTLTCSFAFEGIDVLCRSKWKRPIMPPQTGLSPPPPGSVTTVHFSALSCASHTAFVQGQPGSGARFIGITISTAAPS